MKFQCPDCDFSTKTRESYAGHRSGHVRRSEIEKRPKVFVVHSCKHCGLNFDSGPKLAGHLTTHRFRIEKTFENLRNNGQRKTRLLAECGHVCMICGLDVWLGQPIPLELDHIDGNIENNNRSNFRLLCCNCHAQTPTYKGRNIGKHNTRISQYRKEYRKNTRARSLVVKQPDFNLSL